MHLVTFCPLNQSADTSPILGLLTQDGQFVCDISHLAPSMIAFIKGGPELWAKAAEINLDAHITIPITQVDLLAPLQTERPIICVGKNFPDHVQEMSQNKNTPDAPPEAPVIFAKGPNSINKPNGTMSTALDPTNSLDYEGELAVIIGKEAHQLNEEQVWEHIFGYTILNDITSRRLQKKHIQWFLGKSLDGAAPIGPVIIDRMSCPNPATLRIQTFVNDEMRQNDTLDHMIHSIPQIISLLTTTMTLKPGDIIAMGTPAGVGGGFTPPHFLQKGDVVKIHITPIGILTTTFI